MTNPPKDQNTMPDSLPAELFGKVQGFLYRHDKSIELGNRLEVNAYHDGKQIINALLCHIKTLEMQGKWLDIKDAPRDGTQILARGFIERLATGPCNEEYFCTAKYHKDFNRFIGPNGNEIGHAYLTHFQYINPPSPDAQPEGSEGL